MTSTLTKNDIIEKTIREFEEHVGQEIAPELREHIVNVLNERLPEEDIKTCEDFKYLNCECCETCHTFYAESEMWLVDLPDGGKAWICNGIRGELFPETKVDESNPEKKLLDWILAGNKIGDYCGYLPPDLAQKIFDSGLLESEVSEEGEVPEVENEL